MRIVIADGYQEADYIIEMYLKGRNRVIAINDDKMVCDLLSKRHGIDVVYGDCTKEYDLSLTSCMDSDLFIAMSSDDVKNYVSCKLARRVFRVKRCIAIVSNPRNVEVFKRLGVDYCVSSTYLLAKSIRNEASMESALKTLSLCDDNVVICEVRVLEDFYVCNKALRDIKLPKGSSVSCIYRYPEVIIPNGDSIVSKDDRLYIVTSLENKEVLLKVVMRSNDEKSC